MGEPMQPSYEAPRVLVVEDDALSQDMLVRRLTSRGLRASAVASGEACLKLLANGPEMDLVLLDINLPGFSGLHVLDRVRDKFTRDSLPVILVTAMGETEDVIRGLEAGANDYVIKPINFSVLMARVEVCLRIKRDVRLLMEAERQRVLINAIGEACHQLAQPMTAVMMTLDSLIRFPSDDPKETAGHLRDVQQWAEQVGEVIHRLQEVSTLRPLPFTQRMDILGQGSPQSEGVRRGENPVG